MKIIRANNKSNDVLNVTFLHSTVPWNAASLNILANDVSENILKNPSLNLTSKISPILRNETSLFLFRSASIYYLSSQIFEKSLKHRNNGYFTSPNITNEINSHISNLELKISTELKFLFKKEAEWTSLFNFAEEYKEIFEISDEELWYEFGNELSAIVSGIQIIDQGKRLINKARRYLAEAKKCISSLSLTYRKDKRDSFRHQIAFSIKNLDDEHNSELKKINNSLFINSEFVSNGKKNNYRTFTLSL
jgi:hypothetical protein